MTTMMKWVATCVRWLISIPPDDDAKGIVVRVLNHKYYLRSYTLRFLDPYIEVEYNLSIRRARLQQLVYVCGGTTLVCSYVILFTHAYMDRNEVLALSSTDVHTVNTVACFTIIGISLVVLGCIRVPKIAYRMNWVYTYTFVVWVIVLVQEKLWIDFFVNVRLEAYALHMSYYEENRVNYVNFMIKNSMLQQIMYRALPMVTFIVNKMICVLSISVLHFIEYVVLTACYGCVTMAFVLYMRSIASQYFDNDPIIQYMRTHDTALPETAMMPPNLTLPESHGHFGQLDAGFARSQYDYDYYLERQTRYIIVYWFILMFCIVWHVRHRDRMHRENFILKRVRSNKDARRVDDGGIRIVAAMDAQEKESEGGIIKNNLRLLKTTPTSLSSDTSGGAHPSTHVNEVRLHILPEGEEEAEAEGEPPKSAGTAIDPYFEALNRIGDSWDALCVDASLNHECRLSSGGNDTATTDQSHLYLNDLTDRITGSGLFPRTYTRSHIDYPQAEADPEAQSSTSSS